MTNNSTIHGVSRELLERIALSARRADVTRQLDLNELHRLLDAPAVERQELKPAVRVCGAGYDAERNTVWMETGVVEMPIMRKVEVGEELVFLSEAQSTIACLEARVAELESGRGEPAAWANGEQLRLCAASPREVQPDNPMMHNLPRNIAGSALPTEYCNTPLFTAPPAPVAVVPEGWKLVPVEPTMKMVEILKARLGVTSRGGILNAGVSLADAIAAAPDCLDATAALNGPAK